MKRRILFITLAAVLGFISLYSTQHLCKIKPRPDRTTSQSLPSLEDFNFTEYQNRGADKKFTIYGKRLGLESKKIGLFRIGAVKFVRIKDAEITFYEKDNPVSFIRAKKAVLGVPFDRNKYLAALIEWIDFSKDVSVITQDKRTLTCNSLRWDNRKNRIRAKGNCVLRYEGKAVKADFIDSDASLKDFHFKSDSKKRLRALTKILI